MDRRKRKEIEIDDKRRVKGRTRHLAKNTILRECMSRYVTPRDALVYCALLSHALSPSPRHRLRESGGYKLGLL